MKRSLFLALFVSLPFAVQAAPGPNTLAKIKTSKTITLAYAPDSLPFSFDDSKSGKPAGYSIDLCEQVAVGIRKQLGLSDLKIKWIPGTTPERLKMVAQGKADMECGVTTANLKRQEKVDFTNIIFVQSGGVLTRADTGVKTARDLGGKKIAVVAGTTTENRLIQALGAERIMAEVVPFKDRAEAFKALEQDKVSALAGDKIVLAGLLAKVPDVSAFVLLSEDFSIEPYAFALRRGDPDFRLAVNRALANTYRSGEVDTIFDRWFAPLKPTILLKALYLFSALEE